MTDERCSSCLRPFGNPCGLCQWQESPREATILSGVFLTIAIFCIIGALYLMGPLWYGLVKWWRWWTP